MVKKYYVITAGSEVGVHFDHWTNVAPLVKNIQGSVWERADSKDEAEELYEQARRKGHVRIISNDFARSPASTRAQVNISQRSSSRSGSNRSNPQPSRHTPAPSITESQSEGHVWNSASQFVPARPSPRKMNTKHNLSDRAGDNGSSAVKVLSRTYSEPKQYTHSPNPGSGVSSFRGPAFKFRTETPTRVKANTTGVRVRVESPSWLASYPDEEEEAFITPPLSPITSPKISSGLLGPSRSEPALTFSANFDVATATGAKPASEGGSRAFRSPKPVQQPSSSHFIPQDHLSPNESMIFNLVNRVDMLAKDLHILRVISPSTPITDNLSYTDKTPGDPCEFSQRSIAISPTFEEQESLGPVHSSPAHYKLPPRNRTTTPSETKDLSNGNPPNRSVLFSQSRGSPASVSSPTSTCKHCRHCNGTGYDAGDDTSILERAGLQPTLTPFHSHDGMQDPRSPFTGSKKLRAPVSPVTFGRPSPAIHSVRLRTTPNSLLTSPARRS